VLNAVFLKSAPLSALCGVLNVGSVAAEHLLGRCGGRIMSLIVALGLLASLSAMIWSGPRVTQRVGENHAMLGFLAAGRRNGIPVRAIQLQLLIVLGLMACGSFETVLVFAQIPLLLCLMLGVAGLIVIRQGKGSGEPSTPLDEGKEAAFRCPLYPLPPLVFLVFSLAGLLYSVISRPWVALAGTGIMMLSLILYPWISRKQSA
jgi:APA family basic amino acid/polyamine antiporter